MALPSINPKFLDGLQQTAGSRIAKSVLQRVSPRVVQDVQRLVQLSDLATSVFGGGTVNKGMLDSLMGQILPRSGTPIPLLGGLTSEEAIDIMRQMRNAKLTRKNLFYIRIEDLTPPAISYDFLNGAIACASFDLFAIDVSYSPNTLTGEKVSIGSGFMDKLTGSEATDIQVTTMDDERGTLKRWFEGKFNQAAHPDGTFGLPRDYCINIEVVHAVPSPDVKNSELAYRSYTTMRPVSIQHELSRRDQAMQELQMSFSQFDSFAGVL